MKSQGPGCEENPETEYYQLQEEEKRLSFEEDRQERCSKASERCKKILLFRNKKHQQETVQINKEPLSLSSLGADLNLIFFLNRFQRN